MKLNFIADKSSDDLKAIMQVLPMLKSTCSEKGVDVKLEKTEKGLSVSGSEKGYTVCYSTRASLIRAIGLLVENAGKKSVKIKEVPVFDTLGTMPDQSRCGVQTVETLKKWIRINALMGFNAMMLYTEDLYQIDSRPHFGYMRGSFSASELKELDEYAGLMGIELVPCIQTLAHLRSIFQWQEFKKFHDCDDIMLADDDEVYSFIDDMLDACKKCFSSKRINLGMDEAQLLGSGIYRNRHGMVERHEIMKHHLEVVSEKCRKRGLKPEIWSDMFFRMQSKTSAYYDLSIKKMPKEIVESVPKDITLVYWDYYSIDKSRYDAMLDRHNEFDNKIGFAGGAACWYGLVPLNFASANCAKVALTSVKEKGVRDAWITMWGDDGAACPIFACLSTLAVYSEFCWAQNTSDKHLEKRLMTCCGVNYKDYLDIERINDLPGRTDYGQNLANSYKYMFFQDIFAGKFDRHIPVGTSKHFAKQAAKMAEMGDRNKEYKIIFDVLSKLCSVLEIKAELGIDIKAAYDKKDVKKLAEFADVIIPEYIKRLENYYSAFRKQWNTYNKPFGFEIHDLRIGGLLMRAKDCRIILKDYLAGKIENIPELDVEKIPFRQDRDGKFIHHVHLWNDAYSVNPIMFL